jgi:hypothetical protein
VTHTTDLYFECHVTVEPVFDDRLDDLKRLAKPSRFKVADLLMRKRLADAPERSQFDTFLTGRGTDYADLQSRMESVINDCRANGYEVWRWKIENTLLDVKIPHRKTGTDQPPAAS